MSVEWKEAFLLAATQRPRGQQQSTVGIWEAIHSKQGPTINGSGCEVRLQRFHYCTSKLDHLWRDTLHWLHSARSHHLSKPSAHSAFEVGRSHSKESCVKDLWRHRTSKMAYKTCFNIIKYLGAAIYTADVSEAYMWLKRQGGPRGKDAISWMTRNTDSGSTDLESI